jgi:hypothetical protein
MAYFTDDHLPTLDGFSCHGCAPIAAVIFDNGPVCEWREHGLLVTHGYCYLFDLVLSNN